MHRTIISVLICLLLVLIPAPIVRAGGTSLYEATAVAHGVRLTISFPRKPYPRGALVRVNLTLRNVSRKTYWEDRLSDDFCKREVASVTDFNTSGRELDPVPPTLDDGSCPLALPYRFSPGQVIRLTDYSVLLGPRVMGFTLVNVLSGTKNFGGATLQTPAITVPLQPESLTPVRVVRSTARTCAVISRPPGPQGPMIYEEWPSYDPNNWHRVRPFGWYAMNGNRICVAHTVPSSWSFIAAGWPGYPAAILHGNVPRAQG